MKDQINFRYINETSLEANLEVLEIDFSNYCNLKCIMCNSLKSSSINEEYTKHGDVYKKFGFNVGVAPPCLPRYLRQPQGVGLLQN